MTEVKLFIPHGHFALLDMDTGSEPCDVLTVAEISSLYAKPFVPVWVPDQSRRPVPDRFDHVLTVDSLPLVLISMSFAVAVIVAVLLCALTKALQFAVVPVNVSVELTLAV